MTIDEIRKATDDKIIRLTGRSPVSCRCRFCKAQCLRAPCLGTPQDIWMLIEAGYKDKLAVTMWGVGMIIGALSYSIPMIQIVETPAGCVFFENGLCQLHDLGLKPTEGRLSHHSIKEENFDFSKSLSWNVAHEWLDEKNVGIIIKIFQQFGVLGK